MQKTFCIYIMTNKKNGILYIGVTNDLLRRVKEHKEKKVEGFTKKYNLDKLIYFEYGNYVNSAIEREKVLKRWKRKWKIELIEKMNPEWNDLYYELSGE
ncbi:GIY-YIG nuclease family protein [soil metagenome]